MLKSFLVGLGLIFGLVAATPAVNAQVQDIICENVPGTSCEEANEETPAGLIDKVVNPLLFFAGALAVVVMIFGGFRFMTSAGNQDQVKSARSTIIYAVIGLVVTILAYAMVNFVFERLF